MTRTSAPAAPRRSVFAAALVILTAAIVALGVPIASGAPAALAASGPSAMSPSVPRAAPAALFARCVGWHRITCVVDGDTIWYRGEKIRIADINAPELSHPQCPAEAMLAEAATERLTHLLNMGAFELAPWPGRAVDRYGRSLYIIERGGRSLGMVLTDEGLAERWKGYRGSWCANVG